MTHLIKHNPSTDTSSLAALALGALSILLSLYQIYISDSISNDMALHVIFSITVYFSLFFLMIFLWRRLIKSEKEKGEYAIRADELDTKYTLRVDELDTKIEEQRIIISQYKEDTDYLSEQFEAITSKHAKLFIEYKLSVERPDQKGRDLRPDTVAFMHDIVRYTVDIMQKTTRQRCAANIKVLLLEDGPRNYRYKTFHRVAPGQQDRPQSQDNPITNHHPISTLLSQFQQKDYYLCNDVSSLPDFRSHLSNFARWYNSILVVPIRTVGASTIPVDSERSTLEPTEIWGFLCVDSLNAQFHHRELLIMRQLATYLVLPVSILSRKVEKSGPTP